MTTLPRPALDALSPDDFGRVTTMAATLPPGADLDDERALLLHLHRQRFEAPQIAVLVPFVVEKARELRDFVGLTSAGETLGALGFALVLLSFSFLACVLDPTDAHAAEALATATTAGEGSGPAFFLIVAGAFGAFGALCILSLGAFDASHGLRKGSAIKTHGRRETHKAYRHHFEFKEQHDDIELAAFEARMRERRRRAWHIYIAMGMGGEL